MISAAHFFEENKRQEESKIESNRFCQWKNRSHSTWIVDQCQPHNDQQQPLGSEDHNTTPAGKWIDDLESYLKQDDGSTASKELRQNRHGLAVSSPLRLCSRTLTKSLLAPAPSFCIAGLSQGGSETKPMEFFFYRGSNSNNNSYVSPEVPLGYEELENPVGNAASRVQEEKKEDKQQGGASRVYFVMEIQHRACRTSSSNTQSKASLEEIGLVWDDRDKGAKQEQTTSTSNRPSYLSLVSSAGASKTQSNDAASLNTSAEGIKVKVISSRTLKQLYQSQRRSEEDLSWILDELEAAPALALPQTVGEGDVGSLLLLVSLDPATADNRLAASFLDEKIIVNGHLVLRFQRTERTQSPLSNQLSSANFSVGRQIQVIHHPSSEDEDIQRALQAALCNAERFVPQWKRKQWETVADVLIMVLPHPTLPNNIGSWLRRPDVRRCAFDLAFSNVLLYLETYHLQPPISHYVDKHATVDPHLWGTINNVHHSIVQMVADVRNRAHYHQANGDSSLVTAKTLREMCADIECNAFNPGCQSRTKLDHCGRIQLDYVARMLTALMIERLRCHEDMKKHDMYSIHWKGHTIEIPPPVTKRPTCPGCMPRVNPRQALCPYHLAQQQVQEETGRTTIPGIPIAIRTKRQLEGLPKVLWSMVPGDSLVIKIHVPGVAEDFPLVSIGDLVRLFFRRPPPNGRSTEVVAEVVDVVVKTELVTIRLPSPLYLLKGCPGFSPGCLPYLQALLHTKDFYVDARHILNATGVNEARPLHASNRKAMLDQFRFDIRFGYQGGRGFDIIEKVIGELFMPATTSYGYAAKSRERGGKLPTDPQANKLVHLHRVLAPTNKLLTGTGFTHSRQDRLQKEKRWPLQFVNPINQEQQRAVEDIAFNYHGEAPYIIEGPAGTGKSMCVCEAIFQVLRIAPRSKILVCAPSDAACDVLASRLLTQLRATRRLLRINWWSRKVGSVKPELLSSCPMDDAGSFAIPSLSELKQADVIVCQCFVAECLELAGVRGWTRQHFTHLFIDETSQAMECEALVPMTKVGRQCSIVLAGDPKQLGPTVRDPVAAKLGLGISIQERFLNLPMYTCGHYCVITRLVKNYRSNEALLTVPSSLFYRGSLEAMAPKEVAEPFTDLGNLGPAGFPLLLCNVHDGLERSKLDTPSFYNMEECNAVVSLVQGLLRCRSKEGISPLSTSQICVITPFRAQVLALRAVLRKADLGGINVGVVEDFQGQEAKVVLISTVLTQNHERWSSKDCKGDSAGQRLGFLHDPKRFNVAITRAHALCVIVGHLEYLEKSSTYWEALMGHIRRNGGILGEELDGEEGEGYDDGDDQYGVAELLRRVDELQLLGAGADEDRHELSYFYSDVPQWKVMLS